MDQPAMINGGAFQSASAAPYNLAEIWPFRINGGESGGALDLMKVRFGQSLDQFENASVNREVSGNDPMVLDHRLARSGGSRKRRDESPPENESAKLVSTSIGNDIITVLRYIMSVMVNALRRRDLEMRILITKLKPKQIRASQQSRTQKRMSHRSKITSTYEQEGAKLLIAIFYKIWSLVVIRSLAKHWSLMR
ncbi:hypothetical protein CsSME_00043751 [Camellia sinensis var. sinensis]